MLKKSFFFVLTCTVLFVGCNNEPSSKADIPSAPSASADYQKLSKAFCNCAQPSIDLNRQMQTLSAEGKRDEFVKMAGAVGKEFNKTLSCCQEKKQALTTAKLDPDLLLREIRLQCPDIPDKLSLELAQKFE